VTRSEVIHALVADLTPVRRLAAAGARACLWAGLAIACVGLGSAALGVRPDLVHKLRDLSYLAETAALVAMFGCAARCVFQLGVPGGEPGASALAMPVLGFTAWLVALATRAGEAGGGAIAWTTGLPCAARIAGLAVIPTVALFAMLRRAAPRAGGWTGLLALAAPAALAVIGTQLVCAKDAPAHILVWHAGPLVAAAVIGALFRRRARREIAVYPGDRSELAPLFRLADDSDRAIAGYVARGVVLVARERGAIVGHVQMIGDGAAWELSSIAVIDARRGTGVGCALALAGIAHARERGARRIVVATAAADTRVVRFYQQLGFRLTHVERDAFTPAAGYPADLRVDGIRVLDRVWLALDSDPQASGP
jgi:ribosomal protein S18 acetylase RimI-like enzyme